MAVATATLGAQSDPSASPIWRVAGEGRGRPAADWSTAYFLSKRHEVLAINATTGALRWRAHTGEEGETTSGSTVLLNDSIVVAGDYNVVAFDTAGGSLRWRFVPREGHGPGIYLGAVANGRVFTGSPAGRLYAVDAETGTEQWSSVIGDDDGKTTVFAPTTDGDLVVAAYTTFAVPNVGGVVALDAATGDRRWHAAFPRPANVVRATGRGGGPILMEDLVVAASADGALHAFARDDGERRWTIPPLTDAGLFEPPAQDFRPLTYSRGLLIAGSLTGTVVAYDPATQRERWRYGSALVDGSVNFAIASDDSTVYIPYFTGRLAAVDAAHGTLRWRTLDPRQGFEWPVTALGDRVYAAASSGGFFALRR